MNFQKWGNAKLNELLSNEERLDIWNQVLEQGESGALIRFSMEVEDLCFRRLRGLDAAPTKKPEPKVQSKPLRSGNVISLFEVV